MDQLKELLQKHLGENFTNEVEQELESAFETDAQARVDEETKGLKRKRDELLKQVKDLKNGNDNDGELQEKLDELEEQNKKLQKDYEKLQKAYEKDTKQLNEQLQSEQSAVSQMVVDQGIRKALSDAGVKQNAIDFLAPYFKGNARVKAENGSREAVVDVKDDKGNVQEKPLQDYISEWSQSDQAKEFIKAEQNSGGGANGSNGASGNQKTATRQQFEQMSHSQRAEFARNGGQVVNEE